MQFYSIVFAVTFISAVLADLPEGSTAHCVLDTKPKTNDTIPVPANFTADVIVDAPLWGLEWEMSIAQVLDKQKGLSSASVVTTYMNGTMFEWIFNHTAGNCSVISLDGNCEHSKLTDPSCKNANPLNISASFGLEKDAQMPRNFIEFINWAQQSFQNVWLEKNDPHTVHGIEADHYVSCRNVSTDEKTQHWIEVEICFPKTEDKINPKSIPLMIELKSYERDTASPATNITVRDFVRFNFFNGDDRVGDEKYSRFFVPPPGVICPNGTVKEMPPLPNRFQTHIEYIDLNSKKIDTTEFFYDKNQSLVGILLSQEHEDEPFTQKIINPMPASGNFFVVQDFGTGHQYQLDVDSRMCSLTSGLPRGAGDLINGTVVTMKSPELALFPNVPGQNFTYIGQRPFMNIMADVWAVKSKEKAYEVYFTNGWKMDSGMTGGNAPVPLAILTYDLTGKEKFEPKHPYEFFDRSPLFEGHVHSFMAVQDENALSPVFAALEAEHLDISSCLLPNGGGNEKSLATAITIEKGNLTDLYKAGLSNVVVKLRSKLAELAGVRPLRIGGISFEYTSQNELTLFFTIFPKANAQGTPVATTFPDNEVLEAVKNLNQTLNTSKPVVISVTLQINLGKNVKYVTDYIAHPPPIQNIINQGYTGGSMAALGIIMILIGAAAGMGGGWYLWKRNRGIAYQVYE